MTNAKTLDKQISNYLPRLTSRQKQTVLTVVKTFADEEDEMLYDQSFIDEMDKRFTEMENGKVKTFSLDEVEMLAKSGNRKKKKK
jgi:hypothetical protein